MPNWCYNSMTVIGNKRELSRFLKAVSVKDEHGECGLNHLVPLDPRTFATRTHTWEDAEGKTHTREMKVYATMDDDGFDGYAHAMSVWGVKWGACAVRVDQEITSADKAFLLDIYYETPWGPAEGLVQNLAKQFPNLVFSVFSTEESDAFVVWTILHGEDIVEQGNLDHMKLPPHILEMEEKVENFAGEDDSAELDALMEELWEVRSEFLRGKEDEAQQIATTIAKEYHAYLAYEKRVTQRGGVPRAFIPSV